jgi:hypothetical protein
MTSSQEWRQFEKLVARIEEAAAPIGAKVTSPDRVRELATGVLREVDASIRFRVGTADLLITVECRHRGRPGGRAWIDELAAKRQAIGASKTIAVSTSGFTKPAIVAAQILGIELRELTNVTVSDISKWFIPGVVHICRLFVNIRCNVVLYEASGQPSKYAFTLMGEDVDRPMFSCDWIKSPFPISAFVPILEAAQPDRFVAIPLDGTKVDIEILVSWDTGELTLATTNGSRSVSLIELTVTASYQSAVCDISSGAHHEYKGPDGVRIQHSSFRPEWMGRPVTFHHQSGDDGKQRVAADFDGDDPGNEA